MNIASEWDVLCNLVSNVCETLPTLQSFKYQYSNAYYYGENKTKIVKFTLYV